MLAETLVMITVATRRKPAAKYKIVQPTQHWKISKGVFYRDCIVKLSDGTLRLYSIRDDLVQDVAA